MLRDLSYFIIGNPICLTFAISSSSSTVSVPAVTASKKSPLNVNPKVSISDFIAFTSHESIFKSSHLSLV